MRKVKEWLDVASIEIAKTLGFIVGLIPKAIWLFLFLEIVLFYLCKYINFDTVQIFIIQFPFTLWVLIGKPNKDGSK